MRFTILLKCKHIIANGSIETHSMIPWGYYNVNCILYHVKKLLTVTWLNWSTTVVWIKVHN